MPPLSKLQSACLALLTTPLNDINDVNRISLFSKVMQNNPAVKNFLARVRIVAAPNAIADDHQSVINALQDCFNFISEPESPLQLLKLDDATLCVEHKNMLGTIYRILKEGKDLQLRELSKFELALCAVLSFMVSSNLNFQTKNIIETLTKAVLGNVGEQQKILNRSVSIKDIPVERSYLEVLEGIIQEYNKILQEANKNLSMANDEEVEETPDIKKILSHYQKAYTATMQLKNLGYPNADNCVEEIKLSQYRFALLKAKALEKADPELIKILCEEVIVLAKQGVNFNYSPAQELLKIAQQYALDNQKEIANANLKKVTKAFNELHRRSYYRGSTFKAIREFLENAPDSPEAVQLLNKSENERLKKELREINLRTKEWLTAKYDSTEVADIVSDLHALLKEVENPSNRFVVESDFTSLIHACFKVIEARECLVAENYDEAVRLYNEIKNLNPNAYIIEAYLTQVTLPEKAHKPIRKKKEIYPEPEPEPEVPKIKRNKKVKEDNVAEVQQAPSRKFPPVNKVSEEEEQSPVGPSSSRKTISFDLQTDSDLPTSVKPEPSVINQIQPPISEKPTVKRPKSALLTRKEIPSKPSITIKKEPQIIVEEQLPLLTPGKLSINAIVERKPRSKFWGRLGLALIVIGVILTAVGIVGLTMMTGGIFPFVFGGLCIAGIATGTTGGVVLAADKGALCCKGQKQNVEGRPTFITVKKEETLKSEENHYNNPVNLFTRKNENKTDADPLLELEKRSDYGKSI